jgi:hypothetical protein
VTPSIQQARRGSLLVGSINRLDGHRQRGDDWEKLESWRINEVLLPNRKKMVEAALSYDVLKWRVDVPIAWCAKIKDLQFQERVDSYFSDRREWAARTIVIMQHRKD